MRPHNWQHTSSRKKKGVFRFQCNECDTQITVVRVGTARRLVFGDFPMVQEVTEKGILLDCDEHQIMKVMKS